MLTFKERARSFSIRLCGQNFNQKKRSRNLSRCAFYCFITKRLFCLRHLDVVNVPTIDGRLGRFHILRTDKDSVSF